jgi:hypothetical protein
MTVVMVTPVGNREQAFLKSSGLQFFKVMAIPFEKESSSFSDD